MTLSRQLAERVAHGVSRIGEISIRPGPVHGTYLLHHHADDPAGNLIERFTHVESARSIGTHAEDGSYRFNKARENLKRGWALELASADELLAALDLFYPAAVGLHLAQQNGTLEVQNLREKLDRQTGMYIGAKRISSTGAQRLIRETCGPGNACAKRVLWQIDKQTPLEDSPASRYHGVPIGVDEAKAIPLLCREACNFFVTECRRAAKEEQKKNPAG
ncbi:MAG: DR2241 family protein [Verrucomicrobiota bacterium]